MSMVLQARSTPIRSVEHRLKRLVDVVVSGLVIFLLMPFFLVLAALIHFYDRGPVFFWQDRVGLEGAVFRFPKFRSMVVNAEAIRAQIEAQNQHGAEGVTFKMKNDPRITPVGRFMRRFSIDELPQFLCVFKGEMSLVGPRPALPKEVARYTEEDRRRLASVPGLTCLWQIEGRGDVPFPKQVELDAWYIENWTFWLDVKILLKTIPAVLAGRGAY
ncbi:sugar transferase [Armatimonas rosea]|uniref:Exopolysaccharide biosynthesis polyprenyl glycosylphosphotransferase n=1 Tax=Armatimonas rosea TaxID=685828 RepID=A0A7W9W6F8_ARMRO|nr:sugar transferase [Armatimonas rosea]MBB6049980.1 exopolysaccharide biosynthesis polyprenyl glycosylphosphotransferase [Armatimonas rosea]